jgi:hypothetical protein
MTPDVDIDEARRFLVMLAPGENVTFQTFHDVAKGQLKDSALTRVLHGMFDERLEEIIELHQQGAGVFVMINRGDGIVREGARSCRTAQNVIAIRANYVDLDGAPIQPLLDAGAKPSIVVESSPGKYHVYWLVENEPLEAFTPMQEALIARFGGDPAVKDLPHVLRVPGFLHRKAAPFKVRLIHPARGA